MIRVIKLLKISIAGLLVFTLAACGGGGGGDSTGSSKTVEDSTPDTGTTLVGVVADGYLRNARVFLDRNANRTYDNGEPTAVSGAGGSYSLSVNNGDGDSYPVVVDVIAGQTIDEDTGTAVPASYQLEAPVGRWRFVSPLTTLVKIEIDKNRSLTELQAVQRVVAALGLDESLSVFDDYLDVAGASAAVVAEYGRSHKAGQVVAGLMGQLRNAVSTNLGGTIAAGEMEAVACLISDQIMAQAEVVKQALDSERNLNVDLDVAATVSAMANEVSVAALDFELLTLYQQRLEQNLEVWDMQPPQLLTRTPSPDANAPVSVQISVAFDESLDETLLGTSLVELIGPGGSVSGQLEYDAQQKQLTFVPDQSLLPLSSYQVVLGSQLADSLGNELGEDISWNFNTVFSEMPPALPEIL